MANFEAAPISKQKQREAKRKTNLVFIGSLYREQSEPLNQEKIAFIV
tara:strand:- start:1872 stop:2012 length:141 start_codon:yes stop_codon:yes gene_type:complete